MFQQPESYSFNWLIIIIEDIIVEYEGLQLPIQDSAQFIKKVIRYLLTITSIHNSHKWASNFIQKYMGGLKKAWAKCLMIITCAFILLSFLTMILKVLSRWSAVLTINIIKLVWSSWFINFHYYTRIFFLFKILSIIVRF